MPNAIANASYSNAMLETGWDYLDVNTSAAFPNYQQVYAAGFVEAYLTQSRIYQVRWGLAVSWICLVTLAVFRSCCRVVCTNKLLYA